VQRICDGLTDQEIYRFVGKWLARLPHPFTREDEDADYCWHLSVQQVEFSTTMALDRPASGRVFFEQLIRDNRRLLDAECISHDPAGGAAVLEALTSPVISTTCTRIPGMRFPDPRVQALLGACCILAPRPAGFTSRDLRHLLAPPLGGTGSGLAGPAEPRRRAPVSCPPAAAPRRRRGHRA
jgi:hypothetical protein